MNIAIAKSEYRQKVYADFLSQAPDLLQTEFCQLFFISNKIFQHSKGYDMFEMDERELEQFVWHKAASKESITLLTEQMEKCLV